MAALPIGTPESRLTNKTDRTTRKRPGLGEALAACGSGDTLVVTKLDRLARSDLCTTRPIPSGGLPFNALAIVAEFEGDLIRMRTQEGMNVARAKGRLRGKQPKLNPKQEELLVELHTAGEHTLSEAQSRTQKTQQILTEDAIENVAVAVGVDILRSQSATTGRPLAPKGTERQILVEVLLANIEMFQNSQKTPAKTVPDWPGDVSTFSRIVRAEPP